MKPFFFSPNLYIMSKSTTILDFFKGKIQIIQKSQLMMQGCQPLALMSQFQKIFKQKFQILPMIKVKQVQVLCLILDSVRKYEIMMLMNEMKFNGLTLILVHTNLNQMSKRKINLEVILIDFNIHGLQLTHFVHGLNVHRVSCLLSTMLSF